jgi:hypothetical protein
MQTSRQKERIHAAAQHLAGQTLQSAVDNQMLANGQLSVDSGKLWADSEGDTRLPRVRYDGSLVDEDVSTVRNDISAFVGQDRGTLGIRERTHHIY